MMSSIRHIVVATFGFGLLLVGTGCDNTESVAKPAPTTVTKVVSTTSADALDGQRWYNQACAACHGFTGQGMPRQGPTLRLSAFVSGHTDDELVDFIKAGRAATDPASLMKLQMPPKGTNPGLTDAQLRQIVIFIRQLQDEANAGLTASAGL